MTLVEMVANRFMDAVLALAMAAFGAAMLVGILRSVRQWWGGR